MKKVLAMLLSVAMLIGLMAGCGTTSSSDTNTDDSASTENTAQNESGEKFKVGIITYYVNSSFESSFNTAAIKRCEELGLDYECYDANQDMAAYQTCFENAANAGCNAIVCVPSDPTAMGPQCEICEEYGIYLVVMAVAPDGYYSSALVVDDAEKGKAKAQAIVDACGDGAKVLMLLGNQQQTGWVTENDAAKEVFAAHNVEIVAEEDPQAQMDLGMSYMETWLSQGLEFDAIWMATDTVAAGACAALEQAGYDFDSVFIASEDGDETGLRLVEKGQIDATLVLSGTMYGTGVVDAANEWLQGNTPPSEYVVDMNMATPENVADYIALLPENEE
jgi:ABC-type sugar transport system substrate-binding protein